MSPFNGPEIGLFKCPACGKRRMQRPLDHVVNENEKEFTLESGRKVNHYVDVCFACQRRIVAEFYTPSAKNLKELLKAMHDPANADFGEKSLEEML